MSTPTNLIDALASSAGGLTLAEWLVLCPEVPRRTAQRWIRQFLGEGRLQAQGAGRARRYRVVATGSTGPQTTVSMPWASAIPLSADSADVLAYISRPVQARKPVGYQPDFLDRYRPGETHYLPEPLRRQLHRMGRTAQVGSPAGTYSRAILNRLLIDLSWASSHLEGNTYTRLDTRALIEQGRAAQGKATIETQMILNHKTAIELLVENIETVGFDRYTLLNLHSALAENLLPNPADEGRIRQHAVDIGQSVYRPLSGSVAIEAALETMLGKAARITDPFEQSLFLLVHLPYLQPFADMNKRTSRLMANLPLFRANLCPLTFVDVPESAYGSATLGVYEMTRVELLRDLFVWAYERSAQEYLAIRQTLAEPDPLRLHWRELVREAIRSVVTQPDRDPLALIDEAVSRAGVPVRERADVQALAIEELRRLHEGVLARYGLRPSEFLNWQRRA